jgi:hypothetical protein
MIYKMIDVQFTSVGKFLTPISKIRKSFIFLDINDGAILKSINGNTEYIVLDNSDRTYMQTLSNTGRKKYMADWALNMNLITQEQYVVLCDKLIIETL